MKRERGNPRRRVKEWADLTFLDLFYAYRKAKADCYFERFINVSEAFAEYESSIVQNLQALLTKLREGSVAELLEAGLGTPVVVAKKLSSTSRNQKSKGHGFFSDAGRALTNLKATHDLTPEFRLIGDFPVTTHVISALWINTVGHFFDAQLDKSAYGSRLRRFRGANGVGQFHIDALGSFEPYFSPYRRWRSGSIEAAKNELERDRRVIAVSLDLKSYYHNIDPMCFVQSKFQDELGVNLNPWESQFTLALCSAMESWAKLAAEKINSHAAKSSRAAPLSGGLPIGLSAVRVLSNVLLAKWDRLVQRSLSPIYYGRYVDDILLVLHDAGNLSSAEDLFNFFISRLEGSLERVNVPATDPATDYRISLGDDYQGSSKLLLRESKSKAFFLEGQAGLDLLDSIEMEIASVASERRLMPDLEELDRSRSARVLSAAGSVSEEADTLRRADGLSVRRLGWSIQLRQVETLARDLRPKDWTAERDRFYDFARNHILRPDRILDHLDYLPRLLSLAVSLSDWKQGLGLVDYASQSIDLLKKQEFTDAEINGRNVTSDIDGLWSQLWGRTLLTCREAFLRAYRGSTEENSRTAVSAWSLRRRLQLEIDDEDLIKKVVLLQRSDWARRSYRDIICRSANTWRKPEPHEEMLIDQHWSPSDFRDFLRYSLQSEEQGSRLSRVKGLGPESQASESWIPFLFPTRPYTPQEIAFYVPSCVEVRPQQEPPATLWGRYVNAMRGAWVSTALREGDLNRYGGSLGQEQQTLEEAAKLAPRFQIGGAKERSKIRVGVTSLLTTEETWSLGANGSPDRGPIRYKRINDLVNHAIRAKPRPTHLILPELSLPRAWLRSVSARLLDAGISLIAGLDYIEISGGKRRNEVALVLVDDRLGYRSSIQLHQTKSRPSPGEDYELQHKFGCALVSSDYPKPIYHHSGFVFGILICSELQNVHHRQHFQGKVDALIVLSWNRDRETFSALLESAALDVHSFVVLVNNRLYGDSRVRSPAKEAFRRDLCLLRGGENDYVVVVEIDPLPLREFQSRAKSWPEQGDLFKPVPEGFGLDATRRVKPR